MKTFLLPAPRMPRHHHKKQTASPPPPPVQVRASSSSSSSSSAKRRRNNGKPLRIAFIHPDLGIAIGLQSKGHEVTMYTAHHDNNHCFEETKQGTGSLTVRVYGDYLPTKIFGRLMAVCAYLRNLYTATAMLFINTFSGRPKFDIIIADQISASVPILKFTGARTLFYCHYPDQLLSTNRSKCKQLYRLPIDYLEEITTGMADEILVNSQFTGGVFRDQFKRLTHRNPEVLYPSINFEKYDNIPSDPRIQFPEDTILLLSINRFERKKNIGLCIRALALLQQQPKFAVDADTFARVKVAIAGGYDDRVAENVEHHLELRQLALDSNLTATDFPDLSGQVVFVRSFDQYQRSGLLEQCRCVLYTPEREHFGIVPVEAMYAHRPVIAVNSGGPLESVSMSGDRGLLCPPTAEAFAEAMARMIREPEIASQMGRVGHQHAVDNFSLTAFAGRLDTIVHELMDRPSSFPAYIATIQQWLVGLLVVLLLVGYFAVQHGSISVRTASIVLLIIQTLGTTTVFMARSAAAPAAQPASSPTVTETVAAEQPQATSNTGR